MKYATLLMLLATGSWAATILSGSSSYSYDSEFGLGSSFLNLTLSGSNFGSITGTQSAGGALPLGGNDITGGFGFGPAGAAFLQASFQLNGTTYQAGNPLVTNFLIQLTEPSSGLCCSGSYNFGPAYFAISGSITATVNGVTTADSFSGFSLYSEAYFNARTSASFGKSSTFSSEVPEPSSLGILTAGLVAFAGCRAGRYWSHAPASTIARTDRGSQPPH